ncbi:MAG TPA: glycosyltransferase family 4 protein [Isosphaeraceae bacterium]|nr:glycosyltransferase family 4 protein [Isosphaeraceae bacterium]
MIKLALVTRRYPPLIGGAEKVLSYLASALAVLGADVTVLTSQAPRSEQPPQGQLPIGAESPLTGEQMHSRGRLEVLRLETSPLRFWGTWLYMRNLRRWFRENSVDLAYVSMLKHDAYAVIGAGEESGIPVILRPEGAGATGDVAWQSWGNFGRLIGLRCRRADAFVAISEAVARELEQSWRTGTLRPSWLLGAPDRAPVAPRIVAIPNGVPIPEPAWSPRADWQQSPRAVFLGRLAPEKGLDTLIHAWPLVRQNYPHARLILIGDGPERANLEVGIGKLGLTLGPGRAVEFPGSVLDTRAPLREADLFVLPSREEGMSIALLEAMALGVPLVASAIPGNRRLITDFVEGRLVPPDDPEALARVIIEQWENYDRAIEMGRAARSRVKREFSIQTVARKHLALFHEILHERAQVAGAESENRERPNE